VAGVHEDEPGQTVWHREGDQLGDHAAHRVTQQDEAVPFQFVDQGEQVVDEDL